MTTPDLAQLKFPIGPFAAKENITQFELDEMINTIASAPAAYAEIIKDVSEQDLKKTYRDGSWTVQQVVSHIADMHLLHFFRMKRALTEPDYKEITLVNVDKWATTADGLSAPVADSLEMLEAITKRFVYLMRSLDERQQAITYYHPLRKAMLNQKNAIAMTAWHVQHHLEHIRITLKG
jgi:hypothetical protein